jgi:hypothetical protein
MGLTASHSVPVKTRRCRPCRSPRFALAAIGLLFVAIAVYGCGQREAAVGKYEAVSQTAESRIIFTLELQADGKGFWSVDTDNAPLRWDLHKNTIRLHTQTGGVIQGTLDRDNLQVAVPGQGDIKFTRIR